MHKRQCFFSVTQSFCRFKIFVPVDNLELFRYKKKHRAYAWSLGTTIVKKLK